MVANYTFFWPGVTVVTLTVTNANGTSTDVAGITVQDITPPVAAFTIDGYQSGQNLPVNTRLVFDANQSYDPYNMALKYSWNFGDDSIHPTGINAQHQYTSDGSYNVSLTVTNSAGLNDTVNKTVTVGSRVNPTNNPSPGGTSSPTGNSGQPTPNGVVNSQSLSLPTTVLWTIVFVTILVLVGSVFWLRKSVSAPAVLPG
jgi:PKD repeat protein